MCKDPNRPESGHTPTPRVQKELQVSQQVHGMSLTQALLAKPRAIVQRCTLPMERDLVGVGVAGGGVAMLLTIARQAPLSKNSPGKNNGPGCHSLLQGIFPT